MLQINNIELFENDKINLYRKISIAITTPIIIKTHAQTSPPIVIGKLFEKEYELICFTLSKK